MVHFVTDAKSKEPRANSRKLIIKQEVSTNATDSCLTSDDKTVAANLAVKVCNAMVLL